MRRIVLLLGMVLAVALAAVPQLSYAQETESSVRIMHASPDAPNVDVYLDDVKVATDAPYFTLGERFAVLGGEHRLQVVQAGFPLEQALIDQTIQIETNDEYIVAITGPASNLEVRLIDDEVDSSPLSKARVRIIHLAEAPALDVRLADGDYLLTDQYYGSEDYVDVAPGAVVLDLLEAGTDRVVARTQELRFEQGWNYTLVVTGFSDRDPFITVQSSVDRTR